VDRALPGITGSGIPKYSRWIWYVDCQCCGLARDGLPLGFAARTTGVSGFARRARQALTGYGPQHAGYRWYQADTRDALVVTAELGTWSARRIATSLLHCICGQR